MSADLDPKFWGPPPTRLRVLASYIQGWLFRRRRDRDLMGEAAIALEWWLAGRPVPTSPPETHWYWRHVLTELRNRAGT